MEEGGGGGELRCRCATAGAVKLGRTAQEPPPPRVLVGDYSSWPENRALRSTPGFFLLSRIVTSEFVR